MSKVLEPIKISNMTVKNRIFYAPMGYHYDGYGPRAHDYFIRRAKGGAGMLIVPVFPSDYFEIKGPLAPFLDESNRDDLEKLIQDAHKYDCKICMQLVIGAGRVFELTKNYDTPVCASAVPSFNDPTKLCHEITKEEIKEYMKELRTSLKIIKTTSADAVQIHAYGGYLTDQFLTAAWNKRTDEYGGDVKGRARFLLEIIENIKDILGDDFPLLIKYCPVHGTDKEGYRQIGEGIELSKILEDAGVHMLCANSGCYDEKWYYSFCPAYLQEQLPQLSAVEEIRKHVGIPVASDGKLGNVEKGIFAVDNEKCDALVIGRGMLADPDLPNKIAGHKTDDVRPCLGCNVGCIGNAFFAKPITCAINPEVGAEKTKLIRKTADPKKVLVVGGGPGGIQAALDAHEAGHQVELWEKEPVLGGLLVPAGRPSFKIDCGNYLTYLRIRMARENIDYKLCQEATAEKILDGGFDKVIIATGSEPLVPPIPGIDGDNVVTGVDAIRDRCRMGEHIALIGGGLVGCEAAAYLSRDRYKKIDLVEMMPDLLPEPMFEQNRIMLKELVENDPDITIHTGTKLDEIKDGSVIVEKDGKRSEISCDTVVLAIGLRSVNTLEKQLEGKVDVKVIGDAVKPRHILDAVHEARDAVLEFLG